MATETSEILLDHISVRKNKNGHYCLEFKLTEEQYSRDFYFTAKEFEHLVENKDFWPFYNDGYNLCQNMGTHLRFIRIEREIKDLWLPFRSTELIPVLKEALKVEAEVKIDLLPAFIDSKEKAKPIVHETIMNDALPITLLEGIQPYLDRVREVAKNSSKGQDDPVKLTWFSDSCPKSLYFTIFPGRGIREGGVIFHEHSNSWGIHT